MESLNPGGSLKDRPVLRMMLGALADGRLRPGTTVLDSSSGNAGIAYAMIGRMLGFPVEIVIPDNASTERKKRLQAHGARLVFTDAIQGYDEALREVRRRHEADPDRYFFCDQYSNADNSRAHYETTAEEILAQTGGHLTHLVVGVGTGGTLTGIGRRLKEHDPKIRLVCVIPESFPGIEGLKPLGQPENIVPAILDENADRRADPGHQRRVARHVRPAGPARLLRRAVVGRVHGRRGARGAPRAPRTLRDALQRPGGALLLDSPLGLSGSSEATRYRGGGTRPGVAHER